MDRRENRLGREESPYLRQHRYDPVDWYPWGEEAFARARELDRPLFLSIGYSACHWCHVMAHESFADSDTAAHMNETVIAVKIDREERPDVDAIYMEAVQAATGSGGWPMSVFATPDGRPFFAGTYFPNRPMGGTPAFRTVLSAVGDAWANRRDEVVHQANTLSNAVAERLGALPVPEDGARLGREAVRAATEEACRKLAKMFDPVHGGFGRAPKFPQPLLLDLLLRAHVEGIGADIDPDPLTIVTTTLEAMAGGGIWDHLGGGFSRYSTDRTWLVPHFEKMLYDQALLGRVYLHAWQVTGDERWLQVLSEIIEYTLRDLSLPTGGLASAEDADSEGEEGRFYVWSLAEISDVLGPELADEAIDWWGVTPGGNFESANILFQPERGRLTRPESISAAREALLRERDKRVRPGLDDKVLAEWNAMMCAMLAEAALATGNDAWREAAGVLGDVLLGQLRRARDGRVLRSMPGRDGKSILGYSTDAAWIVEACVRLAECTGQPRWLSAGVDVAEGLVSLFVDPGGGLFTTGDDAEELLVRPRELYDNVTPSATSVAASALTRLGALVGRVDFRSAAETLICSASAVVTRGPTAVPELLGAAALLAAGPIEIAIPGQYPNLVAEAGRSFVPRKVICWVDQDAVVGAVTLPLLVGREDGLAYICREGVCRLPVSDVEGLGAELEAAVAGSALGG